MKTLKVKTLKNPVKFGAVLMCILLLSSCCTLARWKTIDPHEYVEVSFSSTTESELRESGRTYFRDETRNLYYVEPDPMHKVGDYTLLILGNTPDVLIVILALLGTVGMYQI